MIAIETVLLICGILLFLSVAASKVSDRLGVPVLLLFLILGMLAGSEGLGGIYYDDPWLTQTLGTIALVFILFSGGLETNLKDIRPVFFQGLSLATLGVLLTAVLVGLFATVILKFSLLEGLLLGAIISSTDAAAVFNVLRANQVGLKGTLKPLLEFESGSNDPMAVFLTIGLIGLIQHPGTSAVHLIPDFLLNMGLGAILAYGLSRLAILAINKLKLTHEGLYPTLIIALVFCIYSVTTTLKGNGFLAAYIGGILIGNANLVHKKTIKNFCDSIAWLMQIIMFLTLGLLVFPSHIVPIISAGVLISLFLMFVARPFSVYLSLLFTKMALREKTLIAWVGLRGAVPIILATFPLLAKIPNAEMIFNIVFFIVLTSILLQGTTIPLVAKFLKVDTLPENKKIFPIELASSEKINADLEDLIVPLNSVVIGKPLFELNVPSGCLIALVSRDEKYLIPNGRTVLSGGDVLLVIGNTDDIKKLQAILLTKT